MIYRWRRWPATKGDAIEWMLFAEHRSITALENKPPTLYPPLPLLRDPNSVFADRPSRAGNLHVSVSRVLVVVYRKRAFADDSGAKSTLLYQRRWNVSSGHPESHILERPLT